MTIVDYYNSIVRNNISTDDFELFPYKDGFYIGFDSAGDLCVVIVASTVGRSPMLQKTKLLSVECNRYVTYNISGQKIEKQVHIIRCFSKVEKERVLFLDLIAATIDDKASDEEVIDVFLTLSRFFADRTELSDIELIGLYAEIDTILSFSKAIGIEKYWQSQDKMKFDFSFSDTLKLEVKATTKSFRTHHFRHEQLTTDMYDIIVLSYLLRPDDEGVSLFELIDYVRPLLSRSPKKLQRIDRILKNTSDERLKGLKFNPEYTKEKRHFYFASTIPKFTESTPDGVANAEYDCNLDNLPYIEDDAFLSLVKNVLLAEEIPWQD